ncbi:hypothetical protein AB0K02_10195 [Streptomyces sp. NPDC049597]|uniref:hypothetical protein n=1 Tax=Streptomyces sp. NPDC049597 TaxID=3155276 RepID=UPI00341BF0CA
MTDIPLWRRPTRSGWRIEADEARTRVDVIDHAGRVHGSVATAPVEQSGGLGPSLPGSERAPIALEPHDEQAFVSDGKGHGHRRRKKTGHALVHGRRYAFVHTGSSRADAMRDGTRIASFRRRRGTVSRDEHGVLDETDELVLTVFEKLLKPGRPGAVSDFFDGLTSL